MIQSKPRIMYMFTLFTNLTISFQSFGEILFYIRLISHIVSVLFFKLRLPKYLHSFYLEKLTWQSKTNLKNKPILKSTEICNFFVFTENQVTPSKYTKDKKGLDYHVPVSFYFWVDFGQHLTTESFQFKGHKLISQRWIDMHDKL